MASPNVSEIIATTIEERSGVIEDNVSENNALLYRLKERGNVKPFSGGRLIYEELFHAENSTYTRYSGYDTLNVSPSDVISAAQYDIKQVAVAVSMSGLEQLQNSGEEAIIDLLDGRVENAELTMANNMSADCYSDGTSDSSKQIGGLALLIDTTPATGTVGNIAADSFAFWQNIAFDSTTDGGAAATNANIQSYMNRVWVQLVRGTDKPDLIVADNNYFRLYLESMQAIQRVTSEKLTGAGFSNLKYMGGAADVVLDGGVGGACPTNRMYFINTKHIRLRPHKDRNMRALGGDRFSVNQDAFVRLIGWAGNMTARARRYSGVLFD